QHAYSVALSLQFARPYWHYRLGFVLERQEKWREAAGAYRTAGDMDAGHRACWYYRCGYVFEKAGEDVAAGSAYLMTTKACWDAFRQSGAAVYSEWVPKAGGEVVSGVCDKKAPLADITRGPAEGIADAVDEYLGGIATGASAIHR